MKKEYHTVKRLEEDDTKRTENKETKKSED
jgi:hypothetical protein